jgi:hypothetical protein
MIKPLILLRIPLLSDLPNYIAEFSAMMERHGQSAIYYAHAGAGEIHLRPVLI